MRVKAVMSPSFTINWSFKWHKRREGGLAHQGSLAVCDLHLLQKSRPPHLRQNNKQMQHLTYVNMATDL